jgi:hypothetical protein
MSTRLLSDDVAFRAELHVKSPKWCVFEFGPHCHWIAHQILQNEWL